MRTLSTSPAPTSGRLSAAFAVVICAAAVAACGSSDKPNGSQAGGGPALQVAQCMRSHGVQNFPDPTATSGLVIPNDINVESPVFKSAQQACGKLAQAGGGTASSWERRRLQLLALARCMRNHGVASFPDPSSSPPPPGSGNVMGGRGTYLALGTPQAQQAPAYKRAAAACALRVP